MFNITNYWGGKMQLKTTLRYHSIPIRMAAIKKSRNNKCWGGCGEMRTCCLCETYLESISVQTLGIQLQEWLVMMQHVLRGRDSPRKEWAGGGAEMGRARGCQSY